MVYPPHPVLDTRYINFALISFAWNTGSFFLVGKLYRRRDAFVNLNALLSEMNLFTILILNRLKTNTFLSFHSLRWKKKHKKLFQKIQYPPDLEALIENLHSSLGVTLGLPQSSKIFATHCHSKIMKSSVYSNEAYHHHHHQHHFLFSFAP